MLVLIYTLRQYSASLLQAVGYLAQIFTILISIPMISIAKSSSPDIHSILQVDWLHFIESFMFWASIHVQCISFRDSVGSVEKDEKLPVSCTRNRLLYYHKTGLYRLYFRFKASVVQFKPMTMRVLLYFGLAFALTVGHYFANPTSWQSTLLFGGYLNALAPKRSIILCGELSFLTWIFHWSMIYDYVMLLRSMWRWGDFTSKKWKLYTWLHLPACLVNAIVMINHMHRDQIVMLRLLHPVMVFLGSIATFWGSFAIARANGWGDHAKSIDGLDGVALKSEDSVSRLIKGSNLSYTVSSFAFGALLAYASIYLTV
jgi:hypothetical protein